MLFLGKDLYEINATSIAVRVFLALLIGGVLGIERERLNRPAGFRTYMLVCLGSALVMMTNQYVVQRYESGDPTRLGAQVISGIGFLGAGTIILTQKNRVKGITTAASLWSAACLGLAIGIGFYEGAVIVGFSVVMIMTVFKKLDNWLMTNAKVMNVYISFESVDVFNKFIDYCKEQNIKIQNIELSKGNFSEKTGIFALLTLKNASKISHTERIQEFGAFDGVKQIEEI